MKLKDVMIGDWAWDKENDCPWQINIKDFRNDGNSILFFEPIPLTDEILKKNGLEVKVGPGGKYQLSIEGVSCRVDFNIIQYVHELQHAFRLAGIDKEIKLNE